LEDLGLGKYADIFVENEIDFDALRHLTEEDLREIGVALGARRKLRAAIADLDQATDLADMPADEPLGERRQVTVLFSDLSNFTGLSSELGAEATHILLNRYFETIDGIVEGYGGAIDKHIGDNVMAVFGAPIAHSDDPERAVRAALDIHAAMKGLSDDLGRPLTAHIGIASGQVVASGTGSEAHREYTVTGETVNLASRLQDQAAAGETLISDSVRHTVSGLADCAALGEVEVKGFAAPVPVWGLGGLRPVCAPSPLGLFVGRRSERRQFAGIVEDCLETGRGQALLVRGEAGIGKSRLIAEFESEARGEGFAVHKGLVLDFGVGKGQDAIRSLVRRLLDIPAGSGKTERAAAAEAAVSAGALADEQRVFLNDLLDLPQPVSLRSLYDAMDNSLRNEGKRAVVTRLLAKDAGRQPILVVVEDIHWANKLTLAHLAAMAATVAECPAILVMTSRVEGDPLTQAWRASTRGSPLTTIDLGPLRQDEAEVIAANLPRPKAIRYFSNSSCVTPQKARAKRSRARSRAWCRLGLTACIRSTKRHYRRPPSSASASPSRRCAISWAIPTTTARPWSSTIWLAPRERAISLPMPWSAKASMLHFSRTGAGYFTGRWRSGSPTRTLSCALSISTGPRTPERSRPIARRPKRKRPPIASRAPWV
jgi:class 3 adenylate cyclase